MSNEILDNMKQIKAIETEEPMPDGIFYENIEGDKGAPDIPQSQFRIKASQLKSNGTLHIQLGHPDPSKVWDFIKETVTTPFCETQSNRVLRKYGAAWNIPSAMDSIDQHEMMELGHRLESVEPATSFASKATDYVVMNFVGVVDGQDNRGEDVKMLEFSFGNDGKEQLFVAFSHLDVLKKPSSNEKHPSVRQECLLALLTSEFLLGDDA